MDRQDKIFGCLILVVALSCYSQGMSGDRKEEINKAVKNCQNKTNVTSDELKDGLKSNVLFESKEGKCFVKCMGEESECMDEGGNWDNVCFKAWFQENIKDTEKHPQMIEIVDNCDKSTTQKETDPCDKGAQYMKCILQGAKSNNIESWWE